MIRRASRRPPLGATRHRRCRPTSGVDRRSAKGWITMSERICEGQVALVTGASQGGTGTAIAIRLAAEGAKVAITARTLAGLEETRARIEAVGGECLVLPADLSDPDGGRRELVARVAAELGAIDILVNNAAMNGYVAF